MVYSQVGDFSSGFNLSNLHYTIPEITHIHISELSDSAGNIYLQGLILGETDMGPGEGSLSISKPGTITITGEFQGRID